MKHPILAVLLLALFGAGFAVLAAEPVDKAVVIQGNQLKAMPGYVLKKASNKRVLARPVGGGLGLDIGVDCVCSTGSGNCGIDRTDTTAICHSSASGPCSGKCEWQDTSGRRMKLMK